MTKKYNPKESVFYYIFEKKGIFTSYRILSEILNIPLGTLHRVIKELEEESKIKTTSEDNYTHFELVGVTQQTTIFDYAINSDPITFTTRQHRLVDLLKEEFEKNQDRFVGKMEVLFELRDYCFSVDKQLEIFNNHEEYLENIEESINIDNHYNWGETQEKLKSYTLKKYYEENLGSKRYQMKEYADLTKEVLFINEHCDVRQVLIISRAGSNGGIKIAKKSEAADYLEREEKQILKKYDRWHIKRKFLEKDGNFKFVFKSDSKAKNYVAIAK